MRATYLTGDHVYLRALTKDDAAQTAAWRQSSFPMATVPAEKELEEAHKDIWQKRQFLYAICRRETDEIVGSVKLGAWAQMRAFLSFKFADWLSADDHAAVSREALRLTVEWQTGENERPIVIAIVPAWEEAMMVEAAAIGMERMVRFRQHLVRNGERHDMYLFQYIRPDWLARLTNA